VKTLSMNYQALLKQHFGFDEFRPGQEAVIEALEADKAALAVFPTGGGKSLCYQLPSLVFEGVTIVVSPLIALMKDQIDFLTKRGVDAARLDSSLSFYETQQINDRLLSGRLKLLYVAPERFNNERFLAMLRRTPIALFAVDEAHCISEWGHNFRPDYLKLAEIAREIKVQRVLTLTATATPSVVEDICAAFDIPKRCAIVTGFYRPNLKMAVTPAPADRRDAILVDRLRARAPGSTIVYVTLQKTANFVAAALARLGLPARAYHAGMDTEARTEVQEWWMRSSDGIVVATIAFGMGIDKADVRYVYHYNLPKSLESYSQEIGRAGRDGLESIVEMLACGDDVPAIENFSYGDTPSQESLRSLLTQLLEGPDEFDVSLYELSNRHDIRQLVLRTALTYLELRGVLKQGTPFYAGYEISLSQSLDTIIAHFKGEPAQFVRAIFQKAKKGRTWYSLNPDDVARALGAERRRVVRCLEYLEEHGWAQIRAADARMRFTRHPGSSLPALLAELDQRFQRREQQEIDRMAQVIDLATGARCLTNTLTGHFGEVRDAPCGHCAFCVTGRAVVLPQGNGRSPLAPSPFQGEGRGEVISRLSLEGRGAGGEGWPAFPDDQFRTLREGNPEALGEARQAARFLCGLTSPATTKARLTRHPLFGALEEMRFASVLSWCEAA
jgi:ATP-dependent DNA helicase RecQ